MHKLLAMPRTRVLLNISDHQLDWPTKQTASTLQLYYYTTFVVRTRYYILRVCPPH